MGRRELTDGSGQEAVHKITQLKMFPGLLHVKLCPKMEHLWGIARSQFFTDRNPFLTPNQQCQSTEGVKPKKKYKPMRHKPINGKINKIN